MALLTTIAELRVCLKMEQSLQFLKLSKETINSKIEEVLENLFLQRSMGNKQVSAQEHQQLGKDGSKLGQEFASHLPGRCF